MKSFWSEKQGRPVSPWQSSVCGALSGKSAKLSKCVTIFLRDRIGFTGGIAAAVTTPLDVAKTRIMLADPASVEARGKLTIVLRSIYFAQGITG